MDSSNSTTVYKSWTNVIDAVTSMHHVIPLDGSQRFLDNFQSCWPLWGGLAFYYLACGKKLDLVLLGCGLSWFLKAPLTFLIQDKAFFTTIAGVFSILGLLLSIKVWCSTPKYGRTSLFNMAGPYFIPCRTTHSRMFPKKHSFSYSYLMVGLPVGLRDNINSILQVDLPKATAFWSRVVQLSCPFKVDAADHLARGDKEEGLRGKLDDFLKSKRVEPSEFPKAYLVTAPKFLGYSFNPVSFWYLYSATEDLSAIILEVNNTFGERRPYIVFRGQGKETQPNFTEEQSNHADAVPCSLRAKFKKDFHVSPFNSRKGVYSIMAKDPLCKGLQELRGLNMTINLASSKGSTKLVARVFDEGHPVSIIDMSILQKVTFVSRWCWVGFATLPRILKEAGLLFFNRRLHVWFRPEPLRDTFGRLATDIEATLEDIFRRYLCELVERSSRPLLLKYVPSGLADSSEEVFRSSLAKIVSGQVDEVELKVLTPAFYSRFVHYAHDFEAVFCELSENHTISVDRPDLLPSIFLKKGSAPHITSNVLDFGCFSLIKSLRSRPPRLIQERTSVQPTKKDATISVDIRDFRLSSMDEFVLRCSDKRIRLRYRATVLKLFLADKFFLGNTELLWLADLFVRTSIAYGTLRLFNKFTEIHMPQSTHA